MLLLIYNNGIKWSENGILLVGLLLLVNGLVLDFIVKLLEKITLGLPILAGHTFDGESHWPITDTFRKHQSISECFLDKT